MNVNNVNLYSNTVSSYGSVTKKNTTQADTTATPKTTADAGVEYVPSDDSKTVRGLYNQPSTSAAKSEDRTAIKDALKADAAARQANLVKMVKTSMAQTYADSLGLDLVDFLKKGDFSMVTQEDSAAAAASLEEDGFWGVEQTSDRIIEFAKSISGGDSSKADMLLEAFKKGYGMAEKDLGSLPDICKKTYDAVVEKFQAWKDGTDTVE